MRESQNFCDECGAKVIRNRLTFGNLFEHISETFFNYDNKLLRTFIELFTKPEEVIVGYVEGVRKKYVNVISYFGISLTLAGIQVFLMSTFFEDAMNIDFGSILEVKESAAQQNNPFKDFDYDFFNSYQSLIYIIGVPISAFATWVTYYICGKRRFNFTEHLVLNLYYSAQIIIITSVFSILFLLFGLNYLIVSSIIMIPLFIYLYYILKRVFNESHLETIAKFLIVCFVYLLSYIIIFSIFAILAVFVIMSTK
ncbi:DUF3667 domain-containing protein [Winogradskyella ursingii]|uniref:DUF3667 domain-containing protein n=1 Tax=Winogradskyella ursingii TaxID=2686079 RepID=UPI0015CCBCE1|nr:DUF3667 domain-containing protein [Winogradskyella ursingii]